MDPEIQTRYGLTAESSVPPTHPYPMTSYPPTASIEETLGATETVDQPSKQPTQKVGLGVGFGGGVLVGVQIWLKERFGFDLFDIEVGLLTWFGTFAAAYYVKERKAKRTL